LVVPLDIPKGVCVDKCSAGSVASRLGWDVAPMSSRCSATCPRQSVVSAMSRRWLRSLRRPPTSEAGSEPYAERGSMRARGASSWELRVHAGTDPLTGKRRWVTRTASCAPRRHRRLRDAHPPCVRSTRSPSLPTGGNEDDRVPIVVVSGPGSPRCATGRPGRRRSSPGTRWAAPRPCGAPRRGGRSPRRRPRSWPAR